jgi:hypothetical protein
MPMSNNPKLPKVATFIGGPMDQRQAHRPTNVFAGHKRDDGGRTGQKTVAKRWTEPLRLGRWPQRHYRLMLVPSRRSDASGVVAQYWHHSVFWEQARDEDMFWNDGREWRDADRFLRRYPQVDPRAIDLMPIRAADALRLYEGFSDSDEPADVHGRLLMSDLLRLPTDEDQRDDHTGSECVMCQVQHERGEDPFDLDAARLSLVLANAAS